MPTINITKKDTNVVEINYDGTIQKLVITGEPTVTQSQGKVAASFKAIGLNYSIQVDETDTLTINGKVISFVNALAEITSVFSISKAPGDYNVYTALLSQSGTDAPVATVLENTLGLPIVWTRNQIGMYLGNTSTGIMPINKTACFVGGNGKAIEFLNNEIGEPSSQVSILTKANNLTLNDGELYNTAIEIRVYK